MLYAWVATTQALVRAQVLCEGFILIRIGRRGRRPHLHGFGVSFGEAALVPVGVGGGEVAGGVEFGDLIFGEVPAGGGDVLAELFFVAGADDEGGDGGALEEPVEGDLGDGFAGLFGDFIEGVDDFVEIVVGDLGAHVEVELVAEASFFGEGLVAADFAGEAAPAEGAPDDGADAFLDAEGHEFPLVLAADEGVVGLVGDVAGEAVFFGDGEGFHEMPAGEIGAADVADLSFSNEAVEGVEGFLDGGEGVEAVELEEVDVVGAEALEGAVDSVEEVDAGGADVVGAGAAAEGGLGGDEEFVAASLDGVAENGFGVAVGVDVGGVEHGEAVLEADVDEFGGFVGAGGSPVFEEFVVGTAEGAGAEGEGGDEEAGVAELAGVHDLLPDC